MATGLALPISVLNGRAMRASGTAQLQKIIALALSPEDSGNPFQDLGAAPDIFDINDPAINARYTQRITEVFKRLEDEGRARLLSGYPQLTSEEGTGELVATIKYIDLETDSPVEYQYRPTQPGAAR